MVKILWSCNFGIRFWLYNFNSWVFQLPTRHMWAQLDELGWYRMVFQLDDMVTSDSMRDKIAQIELVNQNCTVLIPQSGQKMQLSINSIDQKHQWEYYLFFMIKILKKFINVCWWKQRWVWFSLSKVSYLSLIKI